MTAKSLAAAQFMLNLAQGTSDPSLTPMQLLKLVYIAHGYMLGQHGRPLLDEPVQAWQYGPVVPSVYRAIKDYRSSPVPRVPGARPMDFDEEEKAAMERVVNKYGRTAGTVLSAATHRPGTPWSQTWQPTQKGSCISNDLIEAFYAELLRQPKHSAL
ncbi:putative phage-associated protein [Paucibacter oligotrophus]|uniref:Putative phage-associated protein n=1 Tax=Roseateles oligotrophus TaxID=1769250 RepID=A0A840L1Z8_9BURK|nr:type II toxin-antitoxin system antitoxin SocA domain-containing protein [Roseateles oligotrophus]MBB4842494.1 putative phage-associated protein [Roseateles oligotrophus]